MSASVHLSRIPIGILEVAREGRFSFRYDAQWLASAGSPSRHPG